MTTPSTPGRSPQEEGAQGSPSEGGPPFPSPIASDEAFTAFYKESVPSLRSWLHKHHPELVRDPRKTEGLIADALDELYEKRLALSPGRQPFKALLDILNNILYKERVRDMASLESLGSARAGQGTDLGNAASHLGVPESETRSQASVTGSKELKHIFSQDALMSLTQEQRDLYDLYWVQGKTAAEVASLLGTSPKAIEQRWLLVRNRLAKYMGRLDSEVESPAREPLKTPEQAKRAIEDLTQPARSLLRQVYIDRLPIDQAWQRLHFASKEEALTYLAKGFAELERKFGQKMPEALESALRHRKKEN